MVARTNPTGVLIVSFERDGNKSNTASVGTASGRGRPQSRSWRTSPNCKPAISLLSATNRYETKRSAERGTHPTAAGRAGPIHPHNSAPPLQ